jgi:DICT domain-containing protein
MTIENGNVKVELHVEGPFDFYAAVTAFEHALQDAALAATANDDGSHNKSKASVYMELKRTALVMMLQKRGL